MGMILCTIHGLTHISTCCDHIADAIDANQFERAYVVLDGWGIHSILCQRCREQAISRIEKSTKSSSSGFDLQLDSPLVPCCHSCLIDWYRATGQGDLSKAIAQVRSLDKA